MQVPAPGHSFAVAVAATAAAAAAPATMHGRLGCCIPCCRSTHTQSSTAPKFDTSLAYVLSAAAAAAAAACHARCRDMAAPVWDVSPPMTTSLKTRASNPRLALRCQ